MLSANQSSYKLIVSYDGTRYFGWQKAKHLPTIQGEIEKACSLILQEEVTSEAASRTDRGVHARGQVVQMICTKEINPGKLVRALNSKLPSDIRILVAEKTDPNFHVTLDSIAKTYYYHIDLGAARDPFSAKFSWHYPYKMDFEIMRTAALELVGERNFSAFTTMKTTNDLRRLDRIKVVQMAPHFLRIEITGNRFLYKMARTIAGTLAGIGAGKMDLGALPSLFVTGARSLAGVTAPAHGLTLQKIYYSKENLSRDIIVG
ncbi:MAG TPA: tRNA pseudouridine(38-40) synthase TruA [Chlamydiales bacterium]|nr:tRNA pseudouridine(38-40) synthase TruA [Chlamydiales bacterium]